MKKKTTAAALFTIWKKPLAINRQFTMQDIAKVTEPIIESIRDRIHVDIRIYLQHCIRGIIMQQTGLPFQTGDLKPYDAAVEEVDR